MFQDAVKAFQGFTAQAQQLTAEHESGRNFKGRSPSSKVFEIGAVILQRDQFSVPGQQSLRSDDARHLHQ
jgi:hypothetical protein